MWWVWPGAGGRGKRSSAAGVAGWRSGLSGRGRRSHPGSGRLHWRSRAGLNNDVHVILFSSQAQVLK